MPKTKQKNPAPEVPSDWTIISEQEGAFSAVKHYNESELTAHGKDEAELAAAIKEYERKIQAGQIVPR